jgi:hypothetical protein
VKILFNIQEFLHRKSKRHGTKPMHPFSSRAFQREQERDLRHPGSVDLIGTNKIKQNKTNKLPCFIDRLHPLSGVRQLFTAIHIEGDGLIICE